MCQHWDSYQGDCADCAFELAAMEADALRERPVYDPEDYFASREYDASRECDCAEFDVCERCAEAMSAPARTLTQQVEMDLQLNPYYCEGGTEDWCGECVYCLYRAHRAKKEPVQTYFPDDEVPF